MDPAEIDMLRCRPAKLNQTNLGAAHGPVEDSE
jgi:hypothetical protein